MAIIYSNRNDSASAHSNVSALSTSTWVGGVVPVAADQVYVVGRRTTINQTAIAKWVGTTTITVASTTNFATSGFFYTVTNRGEIVKINYTGTTATTFTGCSVDETDPFYTWDYNAVSNTTDTIPNAAYVHNPAYILEIGADETFECDELIIQEGGWLYLKAGGTLKLNKGLILRDGRFTGRETGNVVITRPAGTTAASTVGYFQTENYQISILDIDGGEVRTYGTLSATANAGNCYVSVTGVTNGSFAVGDEVAIYVDNDYRRRDVGYLGYRDAACHHGDKDEGLDVCGVNGSTIYLSRRNAVKGEIKSVATAGSQKVLQVRPESTYFNAGDKVVIDNVAYTIDSVEDSEITLYDYDFTNTGTSLTDFWVNDTANSAYSGSWEIESGVGLRNLSGGYRELVHKYFWGREVVVEAEMSPLSAYDSGTRGTTAFGIITSYDPAFLLGHRGYDSFKTDYLTNDDGGQDLLFYIRAVSNYNNNRADRDATTLAISRAPAMYRVDTRKMRTTVTIGGEEFTTEYRRDGGFKGTVGIYTNLNTNFRCRSLRIKLPTQKLYITTGNSITNGSTVYESGLEHNHPSGSKIVKIASVTAGGGHTDYAFTYLGRNGSGIYPTIMQLNGTNTVSGSFPYLLNHDFNADYYYNLGESAAQRSVTIDLKVQRTFTHVSFLPRTADSSGHYGYNGVAVYGSNDATNWTTLYGPTNDTKKWYGGGGTYNKLAYYPTGTVTYRYVKFETTGDQGGLARNRYVNIGVHDFSEGYTIIVNNASDFAVGDKITVANVSGYARSATEFEGYYAITTGGGNPESYYHGGWYPECTITSKSGNKLFLDKPIFWGFIEDDSPLTVIKLNKNFSIKGTINTGSTSFNDWRWPDITLSAGTALGRIHKMKHMRTDYVGSYRYSGSTSYNRGFRNYSQDYWNCALFDGIVHMLGPDGTTWAGVGNYLAHGIFRNSVAIGMYTGYWQYGALSYAGPAYYNNKILHCLGYGFYQGATTRQFVFNYNEIATIGDYGIAISGTARTDRMIMPHFNELRYNDIKGTSYTGLYLYYEGAGPVRTSRLRIENNKIRGVDELAYVGNSFDGWPSVNSDFMAQHTGERMSRYRNEGIFAQGDTSSDLSYVGKQENFGRFGYDIVNGVYTILEKDPSRPEVTRIYNMNGDDYLWLFGIEVEVLDNVDVEIAVQFNYKIPWMGRLQDDGNLDGQVRVYSLQNGNVVTSVNGTTPASAAGWQTFNQTYTFSSLYGRIGVFVTRDAQNGYIDIKNSSATVYTDYPDKVKIVGNTFNLSSIWDQYREKRYMKRLTQGSNRAINMTRVSF
jgi:hypothetical protein